MLISRGNKFSSEENGEPESSKSDECLVNLKSMLDLERVVLSTKISRGIFEECQNRVKVVSQCGKWNVGYFEDNVNYLKPHEALHLMEMKRLEVLFEMVVMSMEQAYLMFLDTQNKISLEQYLVYSYLIRAGYYVMQHNPELDRLKYETFLNKTKISKEDDMIWCVLMEKLNLPISTKFISDEIQLYEETKCSMEKFCKRISGMQEADCDYADESIETSNKKRQKSPTVKSSNKRRKSRCVESQIENFLDILKSETEYFNHQQIFQKFSFIKRAEELCIVDRILCFHFDVFIPKANLKKSEDLSNYRVVVLK